MSDCDFGFVVEQAQGAVTVRPATQAEYLRSRSLSLALALRRAKRLAGWVREIGEGDILDAYLSAKEPGRKSFKELGW